VHQQYRNAVTMLIWTNKSSFYKYLHLLLVSHVKKHLCKTIFHPAKNLMRMDMAGGMLSMEGLKVLHICKTDGKNKSEILLYAAQLMENLSFWVILNNQ